MRECWLVDLGTERVTVMDFTGAMPHEHVARNTDSIQSSVLPDLRLTAYGVFL